MRFAASLLVFGLLTACSSQIVVIPGAPLEGASTSVNVQSEKGTTHSTNKVMAFIPALFRTPAIVWMKLT